MATLRSGRVKNAVNWEDIRKPKDLERRVQQKILELSLRAIREESGMSQEAMAAAIDMTQSDLSKLERRTDHLVSSLRRYVEALGGRLEVSAVIDGKRINLVHV
jgi:DNA-binding transcriptional regulator YiaG